MTNLPYIHNRGLLSSIARLIHHCDAYKRVFRHVSGEWYFQLYTAQHQATRSCSREIALDIGCRHFVLSVVLRERACKACDEGTCETFGDRIYRALPLGWCWYISLDGSKLGRGVLLD